MKLLAGCFFSLFACLAITVHANTEKIVFVTPSAESRLPSLEGSQLETITPSNSKLRKALPVAFPSGTGSDKRLGEVSWYLLSNLTPKQRYEVRICWAAVQPTEFWLDTYELTEISKDPVLGRQLLQSAQASVTPAHGLKAEPGTGHLFLRVIAAADFFTTNRTLMQHPQPVDVDIILDPYLANIFPQSLLPTAGYILILALISWPISRLVWNLLSSTSPDEKPHTD